MPPALRLRARTVDAGGPQARVRPPGPPPRLPVLVDRIAEGWWRAGPRTRLALTVLAALLTLGGVLLRVALSPYGPPVPVLIAGTDLGPGRPVGPTDVADARWPRSLLPAGPVATRDDLAGARLTSGIVAGAVLTRAHLRDDGPLAGLAAGSVAVPVPADLVGDLATDARLDLLGVAGDGSGRTVARDARVLTVERSTVWVEVPRERAADVAAAALRGTLSVAVLAD